MQSEHYNLNSPAIVSAMDDCWVWSYPFGEKILDLTEYRLDMQVLDVGCGTGFPAIELSQRLGHTCRTWGIDLWQEAVNRANAKVSAWGLKNIEFNYGDAHDLPFQDQFFDLVISNNGINNVENDKRVMQEIFRVCRKNAQLLITVNLPDTFIEFYSALYKVLEDLHKKKCAEAVKQHIAQLRKPADYTKNLIENAGFAVCEIYSNEFKWRYTNSDAMMNHFMIRLAFLQGWLDCLDDDRDLIVDRVKMKLDAALNGKGISLTVPWICINAKKQ